MKVKHYFNIDGEFYSSGDCVIVEYSTTPSRKYTAKGEIISFGFKDISLQDRETDVSSTVTFSSITRIVKYDKPNK